MNYLKILSYILVFLIGFISCAFLSFSKIEIPLGFNFSSELETPGDWIKDSQIHIYENAIVIDVENASLGKYAATGSMKPVLDENSNGIRIKPKSEKDIKVGDIVTFEQNDIMIIHRVVEIREDEEGVYFITKGDNNNIVDGKIRFKDIKYVTIGVLW